ncbi:MotA/TolQ/ExbB proton channel family protein [Coraliomargarita algicola]|uniref:MotA/TolQ/ExbB proton channel family protein n=1 Tax=Coraliomargarita algicola TaxID=3092156 RepID=A0ABZ0RHE0_9BACT|nr:MotA/TolQ/ExbB proton channel family protein [Coraliomargarita sp. J2-16]WPJ94372.1 MotA/TolQ/ExbB proton channel family protein [Coraliomargarita sp. J2-16]
MKKTRPNRFKESSRLTQLTDPSHSSDDLQPARRFKLGPQSAPRGLGLGLSLLLLPSLLCAQEVSEAASEIASEDSLNLWGLIQQGGWAMYPLGACSLAMFFLIFYSWKETSRKKFFTPELVQTACAAVAAKDYAKGQSVLTEGKTLLGRALAPALPKLASNREKAENLFIENLEAEENSVSQWVTYLNVVASVAPMIGLLGTVSGMISAFQTIGRGGMGRPELLAGDIGEALITTATGLVIGIPAMIAYFVLKNRLNTAMIATAQAGTEVIETDEA